MHNPEEVIIYCDGFMKSKKEEIGGCILAFQIDGKLGKLHKFYFYDIVGYESLKNYIMYEVPQTNMVSEYYALMLALFNAERYLKKFAGIKVFIHSDSEVVVNQLNGYYQCGSKHLLLFYKLCKNIYKRNEERLFIQWVSRKIIVKKLGI